MAHLSKLEREASLRDAFSCKGSLSVLVTTHGQLETVCIPGSCYPVKDSKRKRQRVPAVSAHTSRHVQMHCMTPESSVHTGACGRGMTGQAAPALCPSQPRVSPASHAANTPMLLDPSRPCKADKYVLRQTQRWAEERVWSQWAEEPFVNRFKLLGATNPHAGDGSAGVLCSQLSQPIFRTGASVSPLKMHWHPTRFLHRKF